MSSTEALASMIHPDFQPGGQGWERMKQPSHQESHPDAVHVMARPVDNPQTLDELMRMQDMTVIDMAQAPSIEQMQAVPFPPGATAPSPAAAVPAPAATVPASAPAAQPAPTTATPAASAATDPLLDGKRRVAQAIRVAYDTPGLRAALSSIMVGYEELTFAELMGKLAVDCHKQDIEDRKAELGIAVTGKNDAERKANHTQAIKVDPTIKELQANLKNAEHEYTANLAKRKAVKMKMRVLEAQSRVVEAEVKVLIGA